MVKTVCFQTCQLLS